MFQLSSVIPPQLKQLASAPLIEDADMIRLHLNENSFGSPLVRWYNRYNHLQQAQLISAISAIKNVPAANIVATNGTTAAIDLLHRAFCLPGLDHVITCPPVHHSFKHSATLHNIEVREALLLNDHHLDLVHLENLVNQDTKIIWLCSPNNPTANSLLREDVEMVLNNTSGLVVIDEAYVNFSRQRSYIGELTDYPNLIVLQNLSVAWGLAGLRIAMVFASEEIIEHLQKVNIGNLVPQPVIELALQALEQPGQVNDMIRELVNMRNALASVFKKLSFVKKVHHSDANFILVEFKDASTVYNHLLQRNILVHDCSDQPLCANCLRITVGTEQENTALVDALLELH